MGELRGYAARELMTRASCSRRLLTCASDRQSRVLGARSTPGAHPELSRVDFDVSLDFPRSIGIYPYAFFLQWRHVLFSACITLKRVPDTCTHTTAAKSSSPIAAAANRPRCGHMLNIGGGLRSDKGSRPSRPRLQIGAAVKG